MKIKEGICGWRWKKKTGSHRKGTILMGSLFVKYHDQ